MSYLSRKYILAVLTLVSATALTWFGHIVDGVYITGDVLETKVNQ